VTQLAMRREPVGFPIGSLQQSGPKPSVDLPWVEGDIFVLEEMRAFRSLAGSNPIFLLLTPLQVCVLNGPVKINRVSIYIIKRGQVL
jgi:hypothetical protein